MAGRKNKYTVDYFPHYCNGVESKTMFILENKYGLIGYAVWYKTLELLGKTEYHYIDLRDDTDLLFLVSKLGISEDKFIDIYNLLAKLKAIDLHLWNNKIIFSDNFVSNIEDAYVRRKGINVLHKLDLCKHLSIKCKLKLPNESKVNKSKVKESKENTPSFYLEDLEKDLIFKSWLNYRASIKKQIKAKQTLNSLIKRFKKENIEKINFVVNLSIENGWTGLFWDKQKKEKEKNFTQKKEKVDAAEILQRKYGLIN